MVPILKKTGCRLAMEPGRSIAGNAGILLSRVIFNKQSGDKRFVIQDAAMNDLIRPALYEGFHRIWPVRVPEGIPSWPEDFEAPISGTEPQDVVGPVCESGDFLAKDRHLPPLNRGDLLAVFSAGAYGMVMASNYNTRPRAAEVLVDGSEARLVRRRETFDDLIGPELEVLS
jgi:diaminopimelate decarboxylase